MSFLTTDLFDYILPAYLIAQKPAARRDHSRLLVVDRTQKTIAHHTFADLPKFLRRHGEDVSVNIQNRKGDAEILTLQR